MGTQFFQLPDSLEGTAPAGAAVVYPIQTAPIKAPVIADLQGFGFGDTPIHQGILVVLDALRLVGGDANIVQGVPLFFQPVHLFVDKMCF